MEIFAITQRIASRLRPASMGAVSITLALVPPSPLGAQQVGGLACEASDSLALEALWVDLRGLATAAELEDWETRPTESRCSMLGDMLAERAVRAGLTLEERLAIHYRRLEKARADWGLRSRRVQAGAADSLGRHPDIMFDDRGLIYLRMGEPDEVAYTIAGPGMGNPVEGWRYDRPEGRRIYFFAPISLMGVGVADFRLLDAPWRAVGGANAANQLEILDLATPDAAIYGTSPLMELLLAFQGLDPFYATLAYRSVRGGTSLLQDLEDQRRRTMGDLRFAVDSVPDAPELDPALRFAWERLRFFNPSSGTTAVWLVVAARGADLIGQTDADGTSLYRLDLEVAVRTGSSVVRDSIRSIHRLRSRLGHEDALISRIAVSIGPGEHPFTLITVDGNSDGRRVGNWARGVAVGFAPTDLPEVSDIAVASDSGGAWTRDGLTHLAVSPAHLTGSDGRAHVYFEVYGIDAGAPYTVEVRVVPEEISARMWDLKPRQAAFHLSFDSEMPVSGGIGSHHLRLDLSDTPQGAYMLAVRIREGSTGRRSLPTTTPVIRAD